MRKALGGGFGLFAYYFAEMFPLSDFLIRPGESFFQGVAYYALRCSYGSCVAEFLGCFSYEVGF